MMRQVILQNGTISVIEVPKPIIQKHMVLVQVSYSCISTGTEQATREHSALPFIYKLWQKRKKVLETIYESLSSKGLVATYYLSKQYSSPLVGLGYSCSGQVTAVGEGVKTVKVGQFVACAGAGYAYHADYVLVPEHFTAPLSGDKWLEPASMTTIGTISLQALRLSRPQLGETVCVVGLGLVGNLVGQFSRLSGTLVVGCDPLKHRRETALACGIEHTYSSIQESGPAIFSFTKGHGADITFVAAHTTHPSLLDQALSVTRRGGKVVLVGNVPCTFSRDTWYEKEVELLISSSYGPGRQDLLYEQEGIDYPYQHVRWTAQRNMAAVVREIETKRILLDPLHHSVLPMQEALKAYDLFKEENAPLSCVLSYASLSASSSPPPEPNTPSPCSFVPAKEGRVNIGIVGAGGFVKTTLLPLLYSLKGVKITKVVDAVAPSGLQMARSCNASYEKEIEKLCTSKEIDGVIIASPHAFHAEQAAVCIENGKGVFLEKPAAVTFDQAALLWKTLARHPSVPFLIDFNRALSPFIQKAHADLASRTAPLLCTYRMSAGPIPPGHWLSLPLHGGRLIGEMCHLIHTALVLCQSNVSKIWAKKIDHPNNKTSENYHVMLTHEDGSISDLMYVSFAHPLTPKERCELFYEQSTIIIDDFVCYQAQYNNKKEQLTSGPKKGHKEMLDSFKEWLTTGKRPSSLSLASPQSFWNATKISLIASQLAAQGEATVSYQRDMPCVE